MLQLFDFTVRSYLIPLWGQEFRNLELRYAWIGVISQGNSRLGQVRKNFAMRNAHFGRSQGSKIM